jgi:hypothetical protein
VQKYKKHEEIKAMKRAMTRNNPTCAFGLADALTIEGNN